MLSLFAAALLQPAPVWAQTAPATTPLACNTLTATLRGTAAGPESEEHPDTTRIQAALTGCPAGQAVVLARDGEANSFLLGPVDIPAGVRLLLDPGVVVWAVRDPAAYHTAGIVGGGAPRALITIHNQPASRFPTGVAGWGMVDGRGTALRAYRSAEPALQSWAELPASERPALIEAHGPVALTGLALRDAPGTAVRLEDAAGAQLSDLTIAGGLRGLVLAGASAGIAIVRSTIAVTASAIDAEAAAGSGPAWTVDEVPLLDGTGVISPGGQATPDRFCRLAWTVRGAGGSPPVCAPVREPAWTGALVLDVSGGPSPAPILGAVVRSTRFPAPPPGGTVQLFAGETLLGTAPLDSGGLAALAIPASTADDAGLHAVYDGVAILFPPHSPAHPRDNPPLAPSTVSLTTAGTHFLARVSISIGAAVTPATATGTVEFFDSGQPLGSVPVAAGGVASFNIATLGVGGHLLSAAYAGDSGTLPAVSATIAITVAADPVVLALAPPPAHVLFGLPVPFAVTATPAAANGPILFRENGAASPLGSAALAGGSAGFAASALAVGAHTIQASYGGDLLDLAATSLPVTVTIDPLPTVTAFANLPAQLFFGQALTSTISVMTPASAAQVATGTVTVTDAAAGGVPISGTLSGGNLSFNLANLAPGHHLFVAAYGGDATHSPSASAAGTNLEVLPAPVTLTLAPMPSTPAPGTPIVLTAIAAPPAADGTVLFRESTRGTLGSAPLVNGSATITVPGLPGGSYTISASTSGGPRYAPSSAGPVSLIVAPAPTMTTLVAPPATLAFGSPLTLVAMVANSPGSTSTPPGGTLDFFDGATPLGSAALTGGSGSLTSPALPPGVHLLHASFRGDAVHAASDSAAVAVKILFAQPQITVTLSEGAVAAGDPLFVNVAVVGLPGAPAPTGSVSVNAGTRLLGGGPMVRTVGSAAYATVALDSAALGVGTLPLSASFPGDPNYAPANSLATPIALNITAIPVSESIALPVGSVLTGTSVPVSVHVVRSVPSLTGPPVPTGSVVFARDGVAFATVPLDGGGSASATLSALPPGVFHVSATYQPTGFFGSIPAVAAPLTVTFPLALALTPGTLDLTEHSALDAALTLYPLSGFSGAVSGGCASPVARLTCTLELPAGVNGSPTTGTVHLRITSTTPATRRFGTGRAMTGVLLSLLVLGPTAFRRRKCLRLHGMLLAGLLLAGCGPEGGDFPFGNNSHGAVTITLQAAGSTETIALPYTLPN